MEMEIVETSVEVMSAREQLKWEDIAMAETISGLEEGTRLDIKDFTHLHIRNEALQNSEYDCYMFRDTEDNFYKTSSTSFFVDFRHKFDVLVKSGEEEFLPAIIRKVPSKNYKDGKILLCGIE